MQEGGNQLACFLVSAERRRRSHRRMAYRSFHVYMNERYTILAAACCFFDSASHPSPSSLQSPPIVIS